MIKRCSVCKTWKELDKFYNNKNGKFGKDHRCIYCKAIEREKYKEHKRAYDKQRYWENPEAAKEYGRNSYRKHEQTRRKYDVKKKFGLSENEYNSLIVSQNNLCAICLTTCISGRRLAIDHDHITGKVRGLLCTNCNNGLGRFKDNIQNLNAAIAYLEKHND